ncbi:hypothetical protein CC86DRAFT_405233 [Ophiobolus disseminans]|uniref:Uncharacterized protein n=1 Tax=Ophiobolus disseminans TaxID=1469910 RepID=A0A6A7A505_9PLEO|nr:hypothetical protein CC86DRAFT_405233 [Ophiobolus disseminans]
MVHDFEDAHNERQILACATTIHIIPKSDLEVLRLPVLKEKEEEERWMALLVHPNGMRKVFAQTGLMEKEWQAVAVLLQMVRLEARTKLFGGRDFASM